MLLAGIAVLALVLAVAQIRGIAPRRAFRAFALLWAGVTLANLWFGVARAGYGLAEELPIAALVFAVPAAVGWLLLGRRE